MNDSARAQHAAGRPIRTRAVGPAAALLDKSRRRIVKGGEAKGITVPQVQVTETGGAETHRIRQHGVEHRLKLARRTGDDAEHFGGCSLLLQRFAQLVEQPRVLDGDDGLSREICDELNLLFREWPDLLAINADSPNQRTLLEHWNADKRACSSELDEWGVRIGLFGREVGNMDHLLGLQTAAHHHREFRIALSQLLELSRSAVHGNRSRLISFEQRQHAELGFTNAYSIRQHRFEHWLQSAGRPTDDLKNFGCGGLLL